MFRWRPASEGFEVCQGIEWTVKFNTSKLVGAVMPLERQTPGMLFIGRFDSQPELEHLTHLAPPGLKCATRGVTWALPGDVLNTRGRYPRYFERKLVC